MRVFLLYRRQLLVLALDNVFGKHFKNFAYGVLSINLL